MIFKYGCTFALATLLGAVTASASIIPSYISSTTSGGITTFNYDVTLDAQQNLITGNELCIAGVAGLTGTPTAVAGWTAVDEAGGCPINAGTTSANTGPSVLYTYTAAATILGQVDLGTFTLQSTFSGVGVSNDAYGAVAQKKSNLTLTANQGEVNGPLNPTPEPAAIGLLGLGLVGIGLLRRKAFQK